MKLQRPFNITKYNYVRKLRDVRQFGVRRMENSKFKSVATTLKSPSSSYFRSPLLQKYAEVPSIRAYISKRGRTRRKQNGPKHHRIVAIPSRRQRLLALPPGVLTGRIAPPLSDLPVSPYMDPKVKADKEQHILPKPPPLAEQTPFQQMLNKNAFAQALASPTRACKVTKVLLPRFFLQGFGWMAHPETGEPWIMPRGLRSRKPVSVTDGQKLAVQQQIQAEEEIREVAECLMEPELKCEDRSGKFSAAVESVSISEDSCATEMQLEEPCQEAKSPDFPAATKILPAKGDGPATSSTSSTVPLLKSARNRTSVAEKGIAERSNNSKDLSRQIGGSAYIASRQSIFEAFNDPKSGLKDGWKRTFVGRTMQNEVLRSIIPKVNWRADMDTMLLELQRRRLRESLEWLSKLKAGYLSARESCELLTASSSVKGRNQLAAILWNGPRDDTAEQIQIPEMAVYVADLSEYEGRTKPSQNRFPVYDLRRLLGEDHFDKLKKARAIFSDHEWVAIKKKNMTTETQLLLWKLEGHLATHRDFLRDDYHYLEQKSSEQGKRNTRSTETWPWKKGDRWEVGVGKMKVPLKV